METTQAPVHSVEQVDRCGDFIDAFAGERAANAKCTDRSKTTGNPACHSLYPFDELTNLPIPTNTYPHYIGERSVSRRLATGKVERAFSPFLRLTRLHKWKTTSCATRGTPTLLIRGGSVYPVFLFPGRVVDVGLADKQRAGEARHPTGRKTAGITHFCPSSSLPSKASNQDASHQRGGKEGKRICNRSRPMAESRQVPDEEPLISTNNR